MSSSSLSSFVSLLSFSLSTWLEGSAELRRALILLPRSYPSRLGRLDVDDDNVFLGSHRAAQFTRRYLPWFTRPRRELDDSERFLMSILDVSTAFVLLRLMGSTPLIPLLFDPLSAILPLRDKLAMSSVKWSSLVATTLLLTAFHEAERVSVSTFIAWLRSRKKDSLGEEFKNIVIRGDERIYLDLDNDEADVCIICAGEGTEPTTLSDSISSLPTHSNASDPAPCLANPLEEFCVHAPQKHPMHRACFLAWKDACWEDRTTGVRGGATAPPPVVALACDDESVPVPGTLHWRRALAIMRAARMFGRKDPAEQQRVMPMMVGQAPRVAVAFAPVGPEDWMGRPTGSIPLGQSMFTLHTRSAAGCEGSGSGTGTGEERRAGTTLATMVSKLPSCPACRSAVKMTFAMLPSPQKRRSSPSGRIDWMERYPAARWALKWAQTWNELVTGRTILAKALSQMAFVLLLLYAMRVKRPSNGRGFLLTRSLLPFMHIVSL